MIGRGRRPGRYRPTVMAAAAATAGAALLVSGCTGGGDDRAAGQSDAAAAVTEEGVPPPPGHVGLWFGTEPWGPLDHLVWASQRYIGDPVAVPPVGDRAKGPEARDLPDVCDQRVVDRMVELGLRAGADPEIGTNFVLCSAHAPAVDKQLNNVSFLWGSEISLDASSEGGEVSDVDEFGNRYIKQSDLAEQVGCIAARNSENDRSYLVSYSGGIHKVTDCSDSRKTVQIAVNLLGGEYV